MGVDVDMRRFLENLWLTRIFEAEFGFSDVQSNYSRTYAWMANQLGHMTLGMATVFFFVWIADTITSFAGLFAGCDCWPVLATDGSFIDKALYYFLEVFLVLLNHLLLTLVALGLVGATVGLLVVGAQKDGEHVSAKERSFYEPLPAVASKVGNAIVLILLLAGISVLIHSLILKDDPQQDPEVYLNWIGIVFAITVVAAAILKLCREMYHFIFAMVSVFGALWIATHGFGVPDDARRLVSTLLSVHFFVFPAYALCFSTNARERLDRKEQRLQFLTISLLAGAFAYASIAGLEEGWRMPIAGAICSLAIWWVKEFGSDLPNVYKEIYEAAKQRPGTLLGTCKQVEKEYADDARMDARTDGMFYFAGAWIGAGVVSSVPVLTDSVWMSGAELLGLGVFLLVFIGMGETWAFRQQALDFMGADKASRLAVFHAALRLTIDPKPGEPTEYHDEPLDFLRHFASKDWRRGDQMFDHLIVFGPSGAGVTPLGRAIASEAALASLATFKRTPRRKRRDAIDVEEKGKIRTARFIDISSLMAFMRDIKLKRDITANPTIDLLIEHGSGRVSRSTGQHDPRTHDKRKGANLVVIDDLTEEAMNADQLDALIDNLKVEAMQNTVWLIETGDRLRAHLAELPADEADDWTPDPEQFRTVIDAITEALERQAGGDQKVGVGFVRRVKR